MDPYIPDGDVPNVEHVVPLLGIELTPVTPMGAGLTPGEAISVEPRGTPVWGTAEPAPIPSGEVAAMPGVGLAIPLTCATAAALQMTGIAKAAAINDNLMFIFLQKRASETTTDEKIRYGVPRFGGTCVDLLCGDPAWRSIIRQLNRPRRPAAPQAP